MQDARWALEEGPTLDGHFLRDYGCYITMAAEMAYSAFQTQRDPQKLVKSEYPVVTALKGTGYKTLGWKETPLTIEKYMEFNNDTMNKYLIGIHVDYDNNGTGDHWVGVQKIVIINGKYYYVISRTSQSDHKQSTKTSKRYETGWRLLPNNKTGMQVSENGDIAVPVDAVTGYEAALKPVDPPVDPSYKYRFE